VTDVGVEGCGDSDFFPRTGETPETARPLIETVLKPKGVGRELGEFAVVTGDPFFGLAVERGSIGVPEGVELGVSLSGF